MKKILVIAAHPDDEILGCGGTLLDFCKKGYEIQIIFLGDGESSRKLDKKSELKLIRNREYQAKLVSRKCNFLPPKFLRWSIKRSLS